MNALKKITTRAKQIRKSHPGITWKSAVKRAGAEYRAGKKSPSRTKPKKSRSARAPKKRLTPIIGKKKTGAGPSPVTAVKAGLKERLGRLLLRKELATTKRDKRKIQKEISVARRRLKIADKL
jgi:hypothetical protein